MSKRIVSSLTGGEDSEVVGSPIIVANNHEVEARVDSLLEYCQYSVGKTRLFSTAISQIASLALIIVLGFLTAPPNTSLTLADRRRTLFADDTSAMTTPLASLHWFIDTASNHYEAFRVDGQNETSQGDGIHGTVPWLLHELHLEVNSRLGGTGTGGVGSICGSSSGTAISPQLSALPLDLYKEPIAVICSSNSNETTTAAASFSSLTERFYFVADPVSLATSEATLAALKANAADMVSDDHSLDATLLFYTQSADVYTVATAHFDSLIGTLNIRSQPLQFLRLDTASGIATLTVNIVFGIACLFSIWLTVKTLLLKRQLEGNWGSVWSIKTVYDLLVLGCSAAYLVYAFSFAAKSYHLTSGKYNADFTVSSQEATAAVTPEVLAADALFLFVKGTAEHVRTMEVLFAWVILLAVLRPLFYMQYLTRLSAVSETIVSSIPSLTGCAIVFFLIMGTFAVTGNHLFGTSIYRFRSVAESLKFLFIVVFREGSLEYKPYFDAAPFSAVVFFLLFACLTQVIVLNIVVGVIAASFSASVATMELVRNPDWSLGAVLVDLKCFISRYTRRIEPFTVSSSGISGHNHQAVVLAEIEEDRKQLIDGMQSNNVPNEKSVKGSGQQQQPVGNKGDGGVGKRDYLLYVYERLLLLEALRWALKQEVVKRDTTLSTAALFNLMERYSRIGGPSGSLVVIMSQSPTSIITNGFRGSPSKHGYHMKMGSPLPWQSNGDGGDSGGRSVLVPASSLRFVVQKASNHIGTSDAVLRQSRTTLQRMTKTERMEKQLSVQIKTVGELHKIFFPPAEVAGDSNAGRPPPAATGSRSSASFANVGLRNPSQFDAFAAAKSSGTVDEKLIIATERVIGALEKVRQQSQLFDGALGETRKRVEQLIGQ